MTALPTVTPPRKVSVEFGYAVPSNVAMVSPFVDQVMRLINGLRQMNDSETDIDIALREALVNAIIHGNKEDPRKLVHVSVRCVADGGVAITIRDEGTGFESRSVPDPTAPEHLTSNHGRGIYLMRALMDDVTFDQGGTVVHMRKSPGSPPHQAY